MIDIINKKNERNFDKNTLLYYWNRYNCGEGDNFTFQDTGDGSDYGYGSGYDDYIRINGNGRSRIKV